jgi:tellurite resistance protein
VDTGTIRARYHRHLRMVLITGPDRPRLTANPQVALILQSNFQFGKLEATSTIAKLKSKPDQARAVIQIGIIIGGADGFFDDHEKAVVREACHTLGIPPQEFDL